MRHLASVFLVCALIGCDKSGPTDHPAPAQEGEAAAGDGGAGASSDDEFKLREKEGVGRVEGSKIKPTASEAALRLFVTDKQDGPIPGIVILLEDESGAKHYTEETDAQGYTELLVPIAQTYKLSYLSLGRKDITAKVTVKDAPRQNIKLTLRYTRQAQEEEGRPPKFVLSGVNFETGKAKIKPDSFPRLDTVVEFMTYKKSARIQISGHTDNVGKPKANKDLSQRRADAVKEYIVSKGVDAGRIDAVGFGDEQPIADNATEEGRAANRRIEAVEL